MRGGEGNAVTRFSILSKGSRESHTPLPSPTPSGPPPTEGEAYNFDAKNSRRNEKRVLYCSCCSIARVFLHPQEEKLMIEEFKKFIMRGNVLDMAVGIIIGAAFGKIVSSFRRSACLSGKSIFRTCSSTSRARRPRRSPRPRRPACPSSRTARSSMRSSTSSSSRSPSSCSSSR